MSESENRPEHSGETISIFKVEPIMATGVTVSCPAQHADGKLDDRHSAYHDNISPPLTWTGVPEAKAWAIVVEDPDAPQEHPFVHWMIWNIPGETTSLAEGLPNGPTLVTPMDAIQGRNGMHGYGWFGPRPPAGHGLHHYYFQVFALSERLEMGPDTPLPELLNALKGRTIASGEMAATYEAPTAQ